MEDFKPTVLIGVSTTGGAFTEPVIEAMARHCDRPIIFPLSNPTDKAECTPEQAYAWTEGKALVACGVQFPDVDGRRQDVSPGPGEQLLHLPGDRPGRLRRPPARITDRMFIEAAHATADQVGQGDRDRGMLFPRQADILETEITTAARVVEFLFDQGLATVDRPRDIRAWLESITYKPEY